MENPILTSLLRDLSKFFYNNKLSLPVSPTDKDVDAINESDGRKPKTSFQREQKLFRFALLEYIIDDHSNQQLTNTLESAFDDDPDFTLPEEQCYPQNVLSGKVLLADILSSSQINYLRNKKSWDLSGISSIGNPTEDSKRNYINTLKSKLIPIYRIYLPYQKIPTTGYDILMRLFHLCIIYVTVRPFRTYRFRHPEYFVEVEEFFKALSKALEKNTKILVSGPAGSGKSCCINAFLSQNFIKKRFPDCYCVSYEESFDYTLSRIQFEKKNFPSTDDIWKILSTKPHTSLLVIENVNVSSDKLGQILNKLRKLDLTVIVVSRGTTKCNSFFQLHHKLNDEQLLSIYAQKSYLPDEDQNFKINLLKWSQRNALLISLLGYAEAKQKGTCEQLFSKNNKTEIPKHLFPKHKHPYTANKRAASLFSHASSLYDLTMMCSEYRVHRKYLKILCCFFTTPVPICFLEKIIPEYDSHYIKELEELGYIFYASDESIQMSPFTADIIRKTEDPSYRDLLNVIKNITAFLSSYDVARNGMIGNLFVPFVQRIDHNIPLTNNATQKSASGMKEIWWGFIYNCIEYYHSIHDMSSAKILISLLDYPEDLNIKRSVTDKDIFAFLSSPFTPDSNDLLQNAIREKHENYKKQKNYNEHKNYTSKKSDTVPVNPIVANYLVTKQLDDCLCSFFRPDIHASDILSAYSKWFEILNEKYIPSEIYSYYKNTDVLVHELSENSSIGSIVDSVKEYYLLIPEYRMLSLEIKSYALCLLVLGFVMNPTTDSYGLCLTLSVHIMNSLCSKVNQARLLPHETGVLCFYIYSYYSVILKSCNLRQPSNEEFRNILEKSCGFSQEERDSCLETWTQAWKEISSLENTFSE